MKYIRNKFYYYFNKSKTNYNILGHGYFGNPIQESFYYDAIPQYQIPKDKYSLMFCINHKKINEWIDNKFKKISLSNNIIDDVNNDKCNILLNHSHEPFNNLPFDQIKNQFINVKQDNLIWITGDSNLNMSNEISSTWTNIFERLTYMLLQGSNIAREDWIELLVQQHNRITNRTNRKHKLLLYMRRPKPWRIALMSKMFENSLVESQETIISWGGSSGSGYKETTKSSWDTSLDNIRNINTTCSQQVLDKILDIQHPIKLIGKEKVFPDFTIGKNHNYLVSSIATPSPTLDINDVVNTYFQIVSEARIDNNIGFITEKIYKTIASMQPFVIFGPPNTVTFLENQGYKIKNNFIDHSYDKIETTEKRFNALWAEIERLMKLSHKEWVDILYNLLPDLLYNINNFQKCFHRLYNEKYIAK